MWSQIVYSGQNFSLIVCIGMISRNSLLKPKEIFRKEIVVCKHIINKRKHFYFSKTVPVGKKQSKSSPAVIEEWQRYKTVCRSDGSICLRCRAVYRAYAWACFGPCPIRRWVCRLGLSAMTLNTPISFGSPNDPVKVIFCLAAIDPTSHLELMGELAEVLARDNIIDRLANVQTPEAFIKLLEETRS